MARAAGTEGDGGDLLRRLLEGSRGALARAISLVEDETPGFQELLDGVLREGRDRRRATRVGVTGPPGAGKSTLVTALAARFREAGETVGIVAVDPTSPFSGGALLGDRIRMRDLSTDPGVFIRSMATRKGTGGLAVATGEVADLMDIFGFDRILVETVGVGQTELEVAGTAETVVVVLVPESGDGVQAMKAGLLEISDVFVVNKADRPGADAFVRDLRGALDLRRVEKGTRDRFGEPFGERSGQRGGERVGGRAGKGAEDRSEDRSGERGGGSNEGNPGAGAGTSDASEAGGSPAGESAWRIPVISSVATEGEGIEELEKAIAAHRGWLEATGEGDRRTLTRARSRIRGVMEREIRRGIWEDDRMTGALDAGARAVCRGEETPYSVSRDLLERWRWEPGR